MHCKLRLGAGSTHESTSYAQRANPPCWIEQLPSEVMLHIFRNLNTSNILPASLVCREWNVLLIDEPLWKFFLNRDFQMSETENAKEIYQREHRLNCNLVRGIYALRVIPTGSGTKSDHAYVKGGKLFLPNWEGEIEIWDLEKGVLEKKLSGDRTTAISLVVTKEGKLLSGFADGSIQVWNLETDLCEGTLPGDGSQPIYLFPTTEGKLISADNGNQIKFWDLKSGLCEKTHFNGHRLWIFCRIMTEDGKLISGSSEGKIAIMDFAEEVFETTFESKDKEGIHSLFLTDDERLISGSHDGVIRIWDLKTRVCKMTFEDTSTVITSLYLTKGGKLISGSEDGTIKVWDLDRQLCENTFKEHQGMIVPSLFTENENLILCSPTGDINILDFNVSNTEVFEELAQRFSEDILDPCLVMERFLRMPAIERGQIYEKLHNILNLSPSEEKGTAEDAFHDRKGRSSTPEQKAEAIRNYLSRTSSNKA